MDGGAWWATIHGVAKSRARLSAFPSLLWASLVAQTVSHPPAMQETLVPEDPWKGMATHSSILAWRIPWTEEPGGLQCLGLQRIGHDLVTKKQYNVMGFPGDSNGKESACSVGALGSVPGSGRSPGQGNGTPLQ